MSLRPFEQEMRRRLWWQLSLLDVQASHDRATDPAILPGSFDTRFPLNINDDDLSHHRTAPLSVGKGFTSMTFSLVTFEISAVMRRLMHVPLGLPRAELKDVEQDLAEKLAVIESHRVHVREEYFRFFDPNNSVHQSIQQAEELCLRIMWLIAYQPVQKSPGRKAIVKVDRQLLLEQSVSILEMSLAIEENPLLGWFTAGYVQWHPLAVVLAELCVQTQGPLVVRAWKAVDAIWGRSADRVADSNSGLLWRPIKKLMKTAQLTRPNPIPEPTSVLDLMGGMRDARIGEDIGEMDGTAFGANKPASHEQGMMGLPYHTTEMYPVLPPHTAPEPFDMVQWTLTGTPPPRSLTNDQLEPMAWANWEAFVNDFHGESDPM